MTKLLKFIIVLLFLGSVFGGSVCPASGHTLDFTKEGNKKSNEIFKNFLIEEFPEVRPDIVSYFYDIDNDSQHEILAIVKSNIFYGPRGYKLFVLKKMKNDWQNIETDIEFDIRKNFRIYEGEIFYHKGALYTQMFKDKIFQASYKNGEIRTKETISDIRNNNKAAKIKEITAFSINNERNIIGFEDFSNNSQGNVALKYRNLSEKTKHYLDMH